MLVEIIIVGVSSIALILIFLWNRSVSYWKRRNVPYITAKYPFGNIKDIILMKKTIGEVYDEIYWQLKDKPFGGFFRFWKPTLMIRDPDMIKAVFIKEFNNFHGNDYYVNPEIDPILGLNPFNKTGEEWLRARQTLTPSLTPAKVKSMLPLIVDVCNEMITYLKGQNGVVLEAYNLTGMYSTDVVAKCAYGLDSNSFQDPNSELRQMSGQMFESGFRGNIALLCALYAPIAGKLLRFKLFSEEVNQYFIKIVKETSEYRIENNLTRNDFLQTLINANLEAEKNGKPKVYDWQEMAGHCMSFFLDGFETTSILISFIIYELSLNKDVQEKLRSDILDHGQSLSDFDYDSINGNEYLDMTVMETLRMHTPGTSMARLCNNSVVLHSDSEEVLVEKGIAVVLPLYSIQNDPFYFPNPEQFDPLRFTEENKKLRPEFTHFPFGGGPRSCPGNKFAMTMVKLSIIAILLNFKLEPKEIPTGKLELNPMNTFFHTAKNGLWVSFLPLSNTTD